MRAGRLLIGMLAGNGVAVVLVALEGVLFHFFPKSAATVGLPSLLFVPFCVGLTAAWILAAGVLGSAAPAATSQVRGSAAAGTLHLRFNLDRLQLKQAAQWPSGARDCGRGVCGERCPPDVNATRDAQGRPDRDVSCAAP